MESGYQGQKNGFQLLFAVILKCRGGW